MKYAKILGVLAVAAALTGFAGTASATELTNLEGKAYGAGTKLKAASESKKITIDSAAAVECSKSAIEFEVTEAGSATATVSGPITQLTLEVCGSNTATVLKAGSFEIHTDIENKVDGNGVLTSTGAEITVLTHSILGTVHCIYLTNETFIGTIIGSKNKMAEEATIEMNSAPMTRKSTDVGCNSANPLWTGSYQITEPSYLNVD